MSVRNDGIEYYIYWETRFEINNALRLKITWLRIFNVQIIQNFYPGPILSLISTKISTCTNITQYENTNFPYNNKIEIKERSFFFTSTVCYKIKRELELGQNAYSCDFGYGGRIYSWNTAERIKKQPMRNLSFHFPWFPRAIPRACYVNRGGCISRRWIVFPLCLHTATPSFFRLSHGTARHGMEGKMGKTFPVCPQSASWHTDREWWSSVKTESPQLPGSMTFVLPPVNSALKPEDDILSFLRDWSTKLSLHPTWIVFERVVVRGYRAGGICSSGPFRRLETVDRFIGWFKRSEVYFCGVFESFRRWDCEILCRLVFLDIERCVL